MSTAGFRRLLYVSSATGDWSKGLSSDLTRIVLACTHFNKEHHVTGILSFRSGMFLQVVEGTPTVIEGLMNRISRDSRHSNIRILVDEQSDSRSFSKWLYRLAPSSEMPGEFLRFVGARYTAIMARASSEDAEGLHLFYKAKRGGLSSMPGVSFQESGKQMSIDGTTPALTRGLDPPRLDVVALLLQGWHTFESLAEESGLGAQDLDSLLLRFRECGALKVRTATRPVEFVATPNKVEGGFYATLRRFLLGT